MTDQFDTAALRELAERAATSLPPKTLESGVQAGVSVGHRDLLALLDRLEQAETLVRKQGRYIEELERVDSVGLLAQAERAAAAIERVRAVHGQHPRWPDKCGGCDGYYPCPTLAALDTGKETGE